MVIGNIPELAPCSARSDSTAIASGDWLHEVSCCIGERRDTVAGHPITKQAVQSTRLLYAIPERLQRDRPILQVEERLDRSACDSDGYGPTPKLVIFGGAHDSCGT